MVNNLNVLYSSLTKQQINTFLNLCNRSVRSSSNKYLNLMLKQVIMQMYGSTPKNVSLADYERKTLLAIQNEDWDQFKPILTNTITNPTKNNKRHKQEELIALNNDIICRLVRQKVTHDSIQYTVENWYFHLLHNSSTQDFDQGNYIILYIPLLLSDPKIKEALRFTNQEYRESLQLWRISIVKPNLTPIFSQNTYTFKQGKGMILKNIMQIFA